MTWLTDEWHLLGVPIQNWMWMMAAGFVVYVSILMLMHARPTRTD